MWYRIPVSKFNFKVPQEISEQEYRRFKSDLEKGLKSIKPSIPIWNSLSSHLKLNTSFISVVLILFIIASITRNPYPSFSFWTEMLMVFAGFTTILMQVVLFVTYYSFINFYLDYNRYYRCNRRFRLLQ